MTTWPSVDLPAPFGPMTTWVSPVPTARSISCRMGVSSTEAESPRMVRSESRVVIVMCGAFR